MSAVAEGEPVTLPKGSHRGGMVTADLEVGAPRVVVHSTMRRFLEQIAEQGVSVYSLVDRLPIKAAPQHLDGTLRPDLAGPDILVHVCDGEAKLCPHFVQRRRELADAHDVGCGEPHAVAFLVKKQLPEVLE